MSFWMMPRKPMNRAVMAPITMMKLSAVSDSSNSGDIRATMKMPAVTMVAAWLRAEVGGGASIESGSQTCSGNWADLPMAPMNRQMQITVMSIMSCPMTYHGNSMLPSSPALANTSP